MKEVIKQNSGSPGIPSQTKKTTVERQFYVCFCAKSYNSYSALYLHAKKKHDQNLSMKCLKFKKHEWSGNVKNIFYQFVEQNMSDQEEEPESFQQPPRKKSSKQSSNHQNGAINGDNNTKSSQNSILRQKLTNVFTKYLEQNKKQKDSHIRSALIIQFLRYLVNQQQLLASDKHFGELLKHNCIDIVPHLMNNFYHHYCPINQINQDLIIRELASLSDWLYAGAYCKYLAIQAQNYEYFLCKSETIKTQCG